LIIEELIKDLKNRHASANEAMQEIPHTKYNRSRHDGKSAAYDYYIRQLEKLKDPVVLADFSQQRELLLAFSGWLDSDDNELFYEGDEEQIDVFLKANNCALYKAIYCNVAL